MKRIEYRTPHDRTGWGEGPWDTEPDKVQWQDPTTGLLCLAVRSNHGNWCGYAGVPPGHPLHGHPLHSKDFREANLAAHGTVNFANGCGEGPEDEAICHVPETSCAQKFRRVAPVQIHPSFPAGEPDDVWWFGFDCGHLFDYQPRMVADMRALEPRLADLLTQGTYYRTLAYVEAEVTDLARQLAAVG